MDARERALALIDAMEGVGHEHPGWDHLLCRKLGRIVFRKCAMQCCGAQLGDTPREMWRCEAEAWALEQHPFGVACPELQS